jgi:hypothetical protein
MISPVSSLLGRLEHISHEFAELRDGVQKALRSADEDPDMVLTRTRKVLGYIVHDVYERHIQQPPGTRLLESLLQRLVKDGHFPKRLEAYADAVRKLGNVGAHDFGETPSEKLTVEDVHRSLTPLLPILEWHFEVERPEALAGEEHPRRATPVSPPAPERGGARTSHARPRHSSRRAWLAAAGA